MLDNTITPRVAGVEAAYGPDNPYLFGQFMPNDKRIWLQDTPDSEPRLATKLDLASIGMSPEVKAMLRAQLAEAAKPAGPTVGELLSKVRDALKSAKEKFEDFFGGDATRSAAGTTRPEMQKSITVDSFAGLSGDADLMLRGKPFQTKKCVVCGEKFTTRSERQRCDACLQ